MVLKANIKPLKSMTNFPYLWRKFTYNNSNWAALYVNLRKVQKLWDRVAKVLIQTGVHMKSWVMLYKAVVWTVLLYGYGS